MRPIYGCPEKFWESSLRTRLLFQKVPEIIGVTQKHWAVPGYAHAPFSPKILLFGWTLWMYLPNLKFVALSVPEIIGGTSKIWGVPGFAHAPLFSLWMYRPYLQSVALAVPEIIMIAALGWGCEPPILGKGRPWGSGWYRWKERWVSSYRLFIVTFHLS